MNATYVKCQTTGTILVQADAENQFGFVLADDEMTWPGGFGSGVHSWKEVAESEVPNQDKERLAWVLDELNAE